MIMKTMHRAPGYSLIHSLVRSHGSLIRSLPTASIWYNFNPLCIGNIIPDSLFVYMKIDDPWREQNYFSCKTNQMSSNFLNFRQKSLCADAQRVEWRWNRRVEYRVIRSSGRLFAARLTHSLWSSWERGFIYEMNASISYHLKPLCIGKNCLCQVE